MKILPINNTDDLNELINFLANGFKWSLRKKEKSKNL